MFPRAVPQRNPEHLHSNADGAPDPLHSKLTDGARTPKMASWRRCSSLRPRVCLTSRSGRSRWSASMTDAVASRMVSVAPTQLVAAAVGQQIDRVQGLPPKPSCRVNMKMATHSECAQPDVAACSWM
jgi:hypothetical protein